MGRLGDLFSIILNVVFIFATVSYVASSIGEGLSGLLKWRAKFLLNSIEALLDDLEFTGLARDLYNNLLFNPLGNGLLRSKADVSDYSQLPTSVEPLIFGQAMLEVLGFAAAANAEFLKDPLGKEPPDRPSVEGFVRTATATLDTKFENGELSKRLHGLAHDMLVRSANRVTIATPTPAPPADNPAKVAAAKTAMTQIDTLLLAMLNETADWFSFSQSLASEKYRSRIRGANFGIGLVLAVVLDLQPVPTGGSSLAGKLPYAVATFQWLVVAASTLLGASFWFEILKLIGPGIVGAQKGVDPKSGLAGEARAQEKKTEMEAAAAARASR